MNEEKVCCPKFDPTGWDEKEFEWSNKKFIKGKVCTCFYMPVNFGGVMTKLMNAADAAGATSPEYMSLSDHTSMWNMDLLVAIDRDVPGVENIDLSGRFVSKVYEGDFKETDKWMRDFVKFASSKNFKLEKTYMWYTTCPKCAKKYGKNYVVVVGKVV